MKINNIELEELDLFDLDVMETVENARLKVVDDMQNISQFNNEIEGLRFVCTSIMDCFNAIWGEGTDKKVFGGKTNLMVCIQSFEQLMKYTNKAGDEFNTFVNKYSPNRANRRAKK